PYRTYHAHQLSCLSCSRPPPTPHFYTLSLHDALPILRTGYRIAAAGHHTAVSHVRQPGRAIAITQGDLAKIDRATGIDVIAHRAGQPGSDRGVDVGDRLIHGVEGTANIVVIGAAGAAIGRHCGQGVGRGSHTAISSHRTAATEIAGHTGTGSMQLRTGYTIAAAAHHLPDAHPSQPGRAIAITQ